MPHWCTYPHFEIPVQDGRLAGNSGFPILNIWQPFRNSPVEHLIFFASLYGSLSAVIPQYCEGVQCHVCWRGLYVVPYWCTLSYLDPMIQDGRLAGNLAFSILDIKQLSHSYSSVLWRCSMSHMLMRIVCDALLVHIILLWPYDPRWPTAGKFGISHST